MKLFVGSLFVGAVLVSCQPEQKKDISDQRHHIPEITSVFDAHGGYDQWSTMKSAAFKISDDQYLVDLDGRKVRIEKADRTIGYDGKEVWVWPDTVEAENAAFLYNLHYYFFAMPFILGDSGISYEKLDNRAILGKEYEAIKISFGRGVGNSPKDNYVLCFDPETKEMAWLMYTFTFLSQERSDSYNLIRYDQWARKNGLLLPEVLQWYNFDGTEVGEMDSELTFSEVKLSVAPPDDADFDMPEHGQVIVNGDESQD